MNKSLLAPKAITAASELYMPISSLEKTVDPIPRAAPKIETTATFQNVILFILLYFLAPIF